MLGRIRPALRLPLALASGLLLLLGLWLALPAPIDPAPFEPAPGLPLDGVLAPNDHLAAAERLGVGRVHGPEDVAVDAAGRIYVGTVDGRILRLPPDGAGEPEVLAETGGRPLGLHFDAEGRLVIADAVKGLLRLPIYEEGPIDEGAFEVLSDGADGLPFAFTDDLDIASDGRIYFSDASSRYGHETYLYDLLEARAHGRLLRFDPATGETEMLLDGLYFANGIALSSDESFVLVNETYRYRITRYWLEGPKAGSSDIFIDRLPGFADGVSSNRQGLFWVAMFTVRNPAMDRLHPRPWAKALVSKLPRFLWPKPAPYGFVLALDEEGRPVTTLQDPGGNTIPETTSVEQVGDTLYLGNLQRDFLARIPAPSIP